MPHWDELAIDDTERFLSHLDDAEEIETNKRNILLIEDNKSDALMIRRMLEEVAGRESFYFTNVTRMGDALDILSDSCDYDIILLDLNLLDIEGTASVAALNAQVPNIPIIVYSGSNDPRQKEEALLCGARHYLVKGRESAFSLKFMIQETLTLQQR
ncbi:MAG: response regulator [Alphaproteobacteria bacterium]